MRDDEDEEDDLPPGCVGCLGCLVWPLLILGFFFVLLWFIPLPG